ncbi:MAG TPA: S41 family peptidase [Candidatus Cybelea sp.]
MSLTRRLLLTAFVALAAVIATALYVGYRTGSIAGPPGLQVATTGDLRSLYDSEDTSGSAVADFALRRLESVYYKPISPQVPLNGEADSLKTLLTAKKVGYASLPAQSAAGDPAADGERASALLGYALKRYGNALGATGNEDITDAALRGIMNSVHDPYTVYLSPRENRGLTESLSGGNFGGIGVYIFQLKDGEVIVRPIDAMPAAKAGMQAGDIVDAVDGKRVRGLSIDRVEAMIRGEPGSIVNLKAHQYKAPSAEHSYAVVREIIHVPTVHAKMEQGIDYIQLSDFGKTSADEVRKALLDGKAKGARGYILDLRFNGGGFVDAAVSISSLFIPQGTIVSTIARDGSRTTDAALGDAIGGLTPLVVLVNKYTASASEITSGALQDYRLATLVGTRTFGKGVVQSIYELPDDGALKITTARYLTPAGRDIQHHGIEPNVVVAQEPNPSLIDTPADKQLAVAKAHIRQLLR